MTSPRLRTHLRGLVVTIDAAARRVSLIAGACLIAWAGRVPKREQSEPADVHNAARDADAAESYAEHEARAGRGWLSKGGAA